MPEIGRALGIALQGLVRGLSEQKIRELMLKQEMEQRLAEIAGKKDLAQFQSDLIAGRQEAKDERASEAKAIERGGDLRERISGQLGTISQGPTSGDLASRIESLMQKFRDQPDILESISGSLSGGVRAIEDRPKIEKEERLRKSEERQVAKEERLSRGRPQQPSNLQFRDLGSKVVGLDPKTGRVVSEIDQTPDAPKRLSVGEWQRIVEERVRELYQLSNPAVPFEEWRGNLPAQFAAIEQAARRQLIEELDPAILPPGIASDGGSESVVDPSSALSDLDSILSGG